MQRIHWIGTGLSAIPGLRKLLTSNLDVIVWNRSLDKAIAGVGDLTDNILEFDIELLEEKIGPGDILVSMLPASRHVTLARLALKKFANFVSSSYVSPEMQSLHDEAVEKNLALVNEVGLDPGIDHLMAHLLIHDYKQSHFFDPENQMEFISYCGGIPKHPNDFCYKFSWSPLGVLRALKSPSRSIQDFNEVTIERPWHQIEYYNVPSSPEEKFEVYPNRDSIPFVKQYNFGADWIIKTFIRGTLRNVSWKKAWSDIFKVIDGHETEINPKTLEDLAESLWQENKYAEGEADRVVLNVSLKASKNVSTLYHKTYILDAWGDLRSSAMSKLVSIPVSLAVHSLINGNITPGVSTGPTDAPLAADWLDKIKQTAQVLEIVDHCRRR